MANDKEALVYTNEKCIGCNKCTSVCSCEGACITKEVNGQMRIEVDGSRCVACGACFDVCEHHAREYKDDTERFFEDLKHGEKISVLIAPAFKANYPDEYETVLGGLKENVYWFLGESVFIRQIEGEKHMYQYLELNKDKIAGGKTPYLFIDALNCSSGCIYGTGCESEKTGSDDALCSLLEIREASKKNSISSAWSKLLSPKKRLKLLNRQFRRLKLEDYLRSYTDRSAECACKIPSSSEREVIFKEMKKFTDSERKINCSCCGYDSCERMADAIYNGFSRKENCIYYVKKEVELQSEESARLAEQLDGEKQLIQEQKELILKTIHEINEEFADLYMSVDDMASGNENNASESTEISSEMMDMVTFCEKLSGSMDEINEILKELVQNNNEVVSIAAKTNLLALNASIEAARAGEAGKGFAVVAGEINHLASNSSETANRSNQSQNRILNSVTVIMRDTEILRQTIDEVNGRTQNLAASAEEIAASVTVILNAANSVKEKLKVLGEM